MYTNQPSFPQSNGKVVLNTTQGPIDIELWSKEAPIACKNFVQLCLDGFYNNCSFFRVIRNFIAQTGDPTNSGNGPNRTHLPNDQTFANEFHSRLRFMTKGLVACAGTPSDQSRNANQFFITLDKAPELDKKHTIFGRVVGQSLFNLLTFNELEYMPGSDDNLVEAPSILTTDVIWNPFDDITPRVETMSTTSVPKMEPEQPKATTKAVKNFGLLSFGDEAAEDEVIFSTKAPKETVAPSRISTSKATSVKSSMVSTTGDDECDTDNHSSITSKKRHKKEDKEVEESEDSEDKKWNRTMADKASAWHKAERKADKRDEKKREKETMKRREASGKTESDEEAEYEEEFSGKRKRKPGEVEDIDAPRFKKRKLENGETSKALAEHSLKPTGQQTPSIIDRTSNTSMSDSRDRDSYLPKNRDKDSLLTKMMLFKSALSEKKSKADWKSTPLHCVSGDDNEV